MILRAASSSGWRRVLVLDEVGQRRLGVAHRRLQRNRLARQLEQLLDLVGRQVQHLADLVRASGRGRGPAPAARCVRVTRLIASTMWTGIRIVRAWSAIARETAWRIHQVA